MVYEIATQDGVPFDQIAKPREMEAMSELKARRPDDWHKVLAAEADLYSQCEDPSAPEPLYLKVSPALRRRIIEMANLTGQTVNGWAVRALENAAATATRRQQARLAGSRGVRGSTTHT